MVIKHQADLLPYRHGVNNRDNLADSEQTACSSPASSIFFLDRHPQLDKSPCHTADSDIAKPMWDGAG